MSRLRGWCWELRRAAAWALVATGMWLLWEPYEPSKKLKVQRIPRPEDASDEYEDA